MEVHESSWFQRFIVNTKYQKIQAKLQQLTTMQIN